MRFHGVVLNYLSKGTNLPTYIYLGNFLKRQSNTMGNIRQDSSPPGQNLKLHLPNTKQPRSEVTECLFGLEQNTAIAFRPGATVRCFVCNAVCPVSYQFDTAATENSKVIVKDR
jgi:hypothetical protein